MVVISSLDNSKIKDYVKLQTRKYRELTNTFIIEGLHLVQEAYKAGIIKELILEENENVPFECNTVYVTKDVINKISTLDNPGNVMALCIIPKEELKIGNKILMLDEIQDPGNLGTIIRSAKAFNIDTIVMGNNTVDLYNPKVLRAAQGIMFHINIIKEDLVSIVPKIKQENIPIYVTKLESGEDIRNLNNSDKEKFAIVMGNEGNGVSEELINLADKKIFIEMNKNVESLNVSIATSILLYELNRRN